MENFIFYAVLQIVDHCSEKKELNNSFFSLKSAMCLFLRKTGGIQGIFLSLSKVVKSEQ